MTFVQGRAGSVAAVGAMLCAAFGVIGTAGAAAAGWDPVPETGTPGGLVLDSVAYPMQIPDLSPGNSAYWQIHTRVDRGDTVDLDLQLRKDGALVMHPDGLRVAVPVIKSGSG
jgi:hypothetical protein